MGKRLENAAREPILLLGTLIGVRDRTEQDRGRASRPTRHAAHDGGTVDESFSWETEEAIVDARQKGSAGAGVQRFQLALCAPKRDVHQADLVEAPVMLETLDPYLYRFQAGRGKQGN